MPVELERSIEARGLLREAEPETEIEEAIKVRLPLLREAEVEEVLMPPLTDKEPPEMRKTAAVEEGSLLLMEEFTERLLEEIRARGEEAELVIEEAEMAPLMTRGAMKVAEGVEMESKEALRREDERGPGGRSEAGEPSMEMEGWVKAEIEIE